MIIPSIPTLFLFLTASILLILAPGPDIVFLVTQSIRYGPKAGFSTAMGLASGNLVHTLAAALGLSLVFQKSALAFNLLKIAGALYLLYLCYLTIRNRKNLLGNSMDTFPKIPAMVIKGFLMNITNPRVALFFLAFLPQFVNPDQGSFLLQVLTLGTIFIVLVVLLFGIIGLTAGFLGTLLTQNSKINKTVTWLSVLVYLVLAVRLLLIKL
ncbi:LysE family translocator [bacterium]|nr:LysE family translocator [bacterium]